MNVNALRDLVKEHALPDEFISTVERCYCPVAASIAEKSRSMQTSCFVGVQGCQGSGKSTMAAFLKSILENEYALTTAVVSIDDFYLTKAEREKLACEVHPLLATRGVPGTHDIALAEQTMGELRQAFHASDSQQVSIPQFNKASDDRHSESEWAKAIGSVQVIILEGWCVGLGPQEPSELIAPANALEQEQDKDAVWRTYVNNKLAGEYRKLFSGIDLFVVLNAPSFDAVYEWRLLQEKKLIEKIGASGHSLNGLNTMSPEDIRIFISHYQRLTEHALQSLYKEADWVLQLKQDHSITSVIQNVKKTSTSEVTH
ncbi:MAG: phosphoribulokinase [Agarilytica sp.]